MKQRIFNSGKEAYKSFLLEEIQNNNYQAIKKWVTEKIIKGDKKTKLDNALAFFEAEGIVLRELISNSKVDKAKTLIDLFNSFGDKLLTTMELGLLISAMRTEKKSLNENQSDFIKILNDFEALNNNFKDEVIGARLAEAKEMLGEIEYSQEEY